MIVYIGAYSSQSGEGIYTYEMNPESGRLTQLFAPVKIENPSYLTFDSNRKFLYCVMETTEYSSGVAGGGVAAFRINVDGSLKFLNQQPTSGNEPCYLNVDRTNRFLVAANYGSGSFSIFPLDDDVSIQPCLRTICNSGSGPVAERQSSPHVHFTGFTADDQYLFAVDLGIDQVKFYRWDAEHGSVTPAPDMTIFCRPGSGPRHLVLHHNIAYVANELSSDIGVFSFESGRFVPKQYISTVPDAYQGWNAPAALKLSRDGHQLFVSNRGHDSISAFRIRDDNRLERMQCLSAGSSGPRDFSVDPQEKFLLAANETGNQVNVHKMSRNSNFMESTGYSVALYRPSCVLFQKTI